MIDLSKYKIILASNSPRRAELLAGLDIKFKKEVREVDETFPDNLESHLVAEHIAYLKAKAFDDLDDDTIVIFSDTVVVVDGKVLGKPKDQLEAKEMLESLSDGKHQVYSAVVIKKGNKTYSFTDKADVYFNAISEEEIDYYVESRKPFDKAGAYGIQEWIGMAFIQKINGSYFTVMGLPTAQLYSELKKIITL
ncbi:septum formation protein Maf [Flammeovirga sp. MY04]|uniref:Maf family protein n=1 Tax=Flammeovirga sp. MY04 TaxID=1191459 RepID=UPI00080629D3|nr:Maf family protein [Flammeovirga sp. MY04]ANQ48341.1 septum formation protein Maf [Flammeovirga sp. MY04]